MNPLHNPLLITAFVLLWIYGLCYLLARRSLRKTEIISKQTSGATNVVGVWNAYFGKRPPGDGHVGLCMSPYSLWFLQLAF